MSIPVVESVTTPQTGVSDTVAITVPASVGSTDIVLAGLVNDGIKTWTAPSGNWSQVEQLSGNVMNAAMFWRAGDPTGDNTFTLSSSDYYRVWMMRISGAEYADFASGVGASDSVNNSGTTITAPTITTTAANSLVVAMVGNDRDRGTPALQTGGWAGYVAGSSGGSNGLGGAAATQGFASSSSATGAVDWTISPGDGYTGIQAEILEAVPPLPHLPVFGSHIRRKTNVLIRM